MKKLIKGVICLLGILCFGSCSEVCWVEGKMSDFTEDVPVYMLRQTGEFTYDTLMCVPMKNGNFRLEIPEKFFNERYGLKFGDLRSSVSFFAEPGNVNIEGSAKVLYKSSVKGTPENEKWERYQQYMDRLHKWQGDIVAKIRSSDTEDRLKKIAYDSIFKLYNSKHLDYKDSLTLHDPSSVVALFVNYQQLALMDHKKIDAVLSSFKPYLADNRYYKEMKTRADVLRKIAPGAIAPDFTVQAPDGGKISLASFRGKYLVLDFWASWCAPCREETVFIKKLYDNFHSQGLNVFSVSLDDNYDAWTKAIHDDRMNWEHGCQLTKGGKNTPVAQLYGIDGIPAIWVIGPDGKILAQGLKGEELVTFCKQLFEKLK